MKIKIKKLNKNAVIPEYSKPGDAGMDLVAVSKKEDKDSEFIEYGTGLAFEIPEGYVGLIFPRSSVSKTDLCMANCVAVLDAGYRGELKLRFVTNAIKKQKPIEYEVGDKIGQIIIIPIPFVEFIESNELSESERGEGGFGSTGRK